MGERRRETEKERERERRGSETGVPKLYPTMNMNSLWIVSVVMNHWIFAYDSCIFVMYT